MGHMTHFSLRMDLLAQLPTEDDISYFEEVVPWLSILVAPVMRTCF